MRFPLPVVLAAALAFPSVATAQIDLISNGGFESGALGPWTTTGLGVTGTCPIDNRDFNVSTVGSATGCLPAGAPRTGTYAAYNMFDGAGPVTYRLIQSFLVPVGLVRADLVFWSSIVWGHSGDARRFSAGIIDASATFTSVFDFFSTPGVSHVDTSWFETDLDVTAFLAPFEGQMVSLAFEVEIPGFWTGPAGLGLDDVSLIADVSAPEPTTVFLLGTGLLGMGIVRRRRREDRPGD